RAQNAIGQPEQTGPRLLEELEIGIERTGVVERFDLSIGLKERFLHHILAVMTDPVMRALVAMKVGTKVRDGFEKRDIACLDGTSCSQTGRITHIHHTRSLHPGYVAKDYL